MTWSKIALREERLGEHTSNILMSMYKYSGTNKQNSAFSESDPDKDGVI